MNQYPIDVSGSGDSLLIVASMALASGASIWEASYLGSLAAAIQVSRIGNVPIRSNEIINLIKN
jgi:bifunctional ADP-heptose synthase (sugar kinase/adenylyltransferase)